MSDVDMAGFWDARARENAAYFVDNRLDYSDTDLERLWAGGAEIVDETLRLLDIRLRPEDEVVELGCGVGRVSRALAGRVRSVRALDVSQEMLLRARELNPQLGNVEWIRCDGRSLTGVADASADAFFCHVVFQHLPHPEITYGYVAEIGRVLRPGGWAAFQVSNDPAVHRSPGPLRQLRARLTRGPHGEGHPAWIGSAVDLQRLRATAAGAGMDLESVVGAGTQYCLVRLRRR